jgi:hypothetical protein
MDTYSHVIPGMQEEAGRALTEALVRPYSRRGPSDHENTSWNDKERQKEIPRLQGN